MFKLQRKYIFNSGKQLLCKILGADGTPPIAPNNFWGVNKCIFQERLHLPVLSLLRNSHTNYYTENILGKLFGAINLTSVTPEKLLGS